MRDLKNFPAVGSETADRKSTARQTVDPIPDPEQNFNERRPEKPRVLHVNDDEGWIGRGRSFEDHGPDCFEDLLIQIFEFWSETNTRHVFPFFNCRSDGCHQTRIALHQDFSGEKQLFSATI